MWKDDTQISLRKFSSSHIYVDVKDESSGIQWRLIGFYGLPYVANKNDTWRLLRNLKSGPNSP